MKKSFVLPPSNKSDIERNVFANKSSLILYLILLEQNEKKEFSIRGLAKKSNLSIGLVQRILKILVHKGLMTSKGLRTTKKFILKSPFQLLKYWRKNYSIIDKCKMWTYQTGLQKKEDIFKIILKNNLQ